MGGRKGNVRLCGDDRSEAQGAEQPVIVIKRLKGREAKGLLAQRIISQSWRPCQGAVSADREGILAGVFSPYTINANL